jgi:hypothetical protein
LLFLLFLFDDALLFHVSFFFINKIEEKIEQS